MPRRAVRGFTTCWSGPCLPDLRARAGETARHRQPHPADLGVVGVGTRPRSCSPVESARGRRCGPCRTIAFLASGIEGIKVRLTGEGPGSGKAASAALEAETAELRALLGRFIFGMGRRHDGVGRRPAAESTADGPIGLAESLTGGLVALSDRVRAGGLGVVSAALWFRYASDVKALGARCRGGAGRFGFFGVRNGPGCSPRALFGRPGCQ